MDKLCGTLGSAMGALDRLVPEISKGHGAGGGGSGSSAGVDPMDWFQKRLAMIDSLLLAGTVSQSEADKARAAALERFNAM